MGCRPTSPIPGARRWTMRPPRCSPPRSPRAVRKTRRTSTRTTAVPRSIALIASRLRRSTISSTNAPIYTHESPECATVLSNVNSNLNGDSTAIDRPIINPNGKRGTATTVVPQFASNLANLCQPSDNGQCANNTVGYIAVDPNAYYIQAGAGTLPTASRNTLPTRPINNIDMSAYKRLTFHEHYSFELGAQAYNELNHAQYDQSTVGNNNQTTNTTSVINFQKVDNAFFGQPGKVFQNNARTMQLSGKFFF